MSTSALVKRSLGTFLGLFGTTLAVTWVFLGMRAVMEIGGSCASGGPYVVANPCPEGVPGLLIGGILGGLICLFIYSIFVFDVGPRLALLGWPALFLSLGYNFLDYGLDPATGDGPVVSLLVCAVIFGLMGGLPLLYLFKPANAKALFWSDGARPVTPLTLPRPDPATADRFAGVLPPDPPAGSATATPADADADAIVVALERLTALRDRGAISEAEFAKAKARILDEETR
ncbi:hypothetical protein GCM10009682_44670 [Luedemannella flava]|uniref:SHOCT domain-containing protein n=1 Tax=Luedemannella flava TaxID=349316 RepID=A0ABN2MCV6_9ACTN